MRSLAAAVTLFVAACPGNEPGRAPVPGSAATSARGPTMDPHSPDPACADALDRLRRRELDRWTGLPASCRADDLAHLGTVGDAPRPAVLGEAAAPATWTTITVDGYDAPLRAFLRDGAPVLLDVDAPALSASLPGWRAALGEPAARLDYTWGSIPVAGGEHL
jgi:hypothetical protein